MLEMKQYQCEFCKTVYKERDKAVACEKNHKTPKTVFAKNYLSQKSEPTGYPTEISVHMDNGDTVTYTYLKKEK
jgi:hypothetical protein